MIVQLADYELAFVDAEGRPWGGPHRGKGTHLGDVIRYIGDKLGLSKNKTNNPLYAQAGFVFEAGWRLYAKNRKSIVGRSEITVDGIHMNHDGFCIDDDTLEELKATWRSVRQMCDEDGEFDPVKFQEEFWDWNIQIPSYCRNVGATKARLIPLFVNGDYRPPAPMLGVYGKIVEFRYKKVELERLWGMVVKEARAMEQEIRRGTWSKNRD